MKTLVIIEHDNNSIKQTSLSTITAASKVCDDVEALVLGHEITNLVEDISKTNIIKNNFVDDKILKNIKSQKICAIL